MDSMINKHFVFNWNYVSYYTSLRNISKNTLQNKTASYRIFSRLLSTHKHVKARNRHNAHTGEWTFLRCFVIAICCWVAEAMCEFCNCFERAKTKHTLGVFPLHFPFTSCVFLIFANDPRSPFRDVSVFFKQKLAKVSRFHANFFASSFACLLNLFPQQLCKC